MHELGEVCDMDLAAVCLSPPDKWELSARTGRDCDCDPDWWEVVMDTSRSGTERTREQASGRGSREWLTGGRRDGPLGRAAVGLSRGTREPHSASYNWDCR